MKSRCCGCLTARHLFIMCWAWRLAMRNSWQHQNYWRRYSSCQNHFGRNAVRSGRFSNSCEQTAQHYRWKSWFGKSTIPQTFFLSCSCIRTARKNVPIWTCWFSMPDNMRHRDRQLLPAVWQASCGILMPCWNMTEIWSRRTPPTEQIVRCSWKPCTVPRGWNFRLYFWQNWKQSFPSRTALKKCTFPIREEWGCIYTMQRIIKNIKLYPIWYCWKRKNSSCYKKKCGCCM